jgi:tRNA(fMet)-specific endonuclease VapC
VASYLFKWTLKRRWGPQKIEQLEATLRRNTCEDAGRPMAPSDAWVAAAALRHDISLLTNNLKHYEAAKSEI